MPEEEKASEKKEEKPKVQKPIILKTGRVMDSDSTKDRSKVLNEKKPNN
jgi:hypothetical protein